MTEEIKDTIKVGDEVLSYDFEGRDDCFIEGTVVDKGEEIEGCARYKIKVLRVVREGETVPNQWGEFVFPPVNGIQKTFGGVTNGVKKRDPENVRKVDKRSELQKILDGDSDYCHAKSVKAVYEALCEHGNNEDFLLGVLEIIHDGIEQQKKDRAKCISAIIKRKRARA